jgi:hypothetical protein
MTLPHLGLGGLFQGDILQLHGWVQVLFLVIIASRSEYSKTERWPGFKYFRVELPLA